MEIIHHLVLVTNHFCVMYKININRPPKSVRVCVRCHPICSERLAREPASKGHTGGRSRKIAQPAGPLLCTTIIKSHFVHERLIVPIQDYVLYK